MNPIITEKMKNQFLLLLPKWCNEVGTTEPLIEYEFSLATKWYAEQLPLLKKQNSVGQDYQLDVVKHLVADGLLNQNNLTFKLTPTGITKIKELSKPHIAESSKQQTVNWQNSKIQYILIGIIIVVIGGLILKSISP